MEFQEAKQTYDLIRQHLNNICKDASGYYKARYKKIENETGEYGIIVVQVSFQNGRIGVFVPGMSEETNPEDYDIYEKVA